MFGSVEGVTNFILVDRDNLLATAFEELTSHDDLRPTLEVQFYGEVSGNLPTKELTFHCVYTGLHQ